MDRYSRLRRDCHATLCQGQRPIMLPRDERQNEFVRTGRTLSQHGTIEGPQRVGSCLSHRALFGRDCVKTQKHSVFGCRLTLPELLPSQYGAI